MISKKSTMCFKLLGHVIVFLVKPELKSLNLKWEKTMNLLIIKQNKEYSVTKMYAPHHLYQ